MDDGGLTIAVRFGKALLCVLGFECESERERGAALGECLVQQGEDVEGESFSWAGGVNGAWIELEREDGLDEEEVHDERWNALEEGDVVRVAAEWMAGGAKEVLFLVWVCSEEGRIHAERNARRLHQSHLCGILHKLGLEGELQRKLLDGVVLEAEAVAKEQFIVLLWSVVVE